MKFSPQLQEKQNETYATVKDTIVQNIKKSYKGGFDVAKSLKDMQIVDLSLEEPQRAMSTNADAAKAKIEQKGLDIKYQEELHRHLDHKDALRDGLKSAYALIFSTYCTKAMQARIEEHLNYSQIENDPIALLEAIKTLVHDPVRVQYL